MTSTVAVAMATYNGGKYIRQQLDSLTAQTILPAELVIADDGSTDDTLSIVAAFTDQAPFPVRVQRNPTRLGYRNNFMHAASLCTADLIAFCDQDDIWDIDKIAACAEPFSDPDTLLVFHPATMIDAAGTQTGTLDRFAVAERMMPPLSTDPTQYTLGFTEVFRRSLLDLSKYWPVSLDEVNYQAISMAHDRWVYFLAAVFGNIAYVDRPLVAYRQHTANVYGAGAWWHKYRRTLSYPVMLIDELVERERSIGFRFDVLERVASDPSTPWRARAAAAAARYRTMVEANEQRRRLYEAPSLTDRLAAFRSLTSTDAYRPKPAWGLGRKLLLADLMLGLPIGNRLFRAAQANPSSWLSVTARSDQNGPTRGAG